MWNTDEGQWRLMPKGDNRLRTDTGLLNGVGQRVKSRRQRLNMTREQLCVRMEEVTHGGWKLQTQELYRVESGTRIVSDLELGALAETLECDSAWLLTGRHDLAPDV